MIFYLLLGASLLIYTVVQNTALKKCLNALEDHRPHSSPFRNQSENEKFDPCKIITPENFVLKLCTCDYVNGIIYYTIFDVDRFSGGLSPNR